MVSLKTKIIMADAAPRPVMKLKNGIPVIIATAEKIPTTHANIMNT